MDGRTRAALQRSFKRVAATAPTQKAFVLGADDLRHLEAIGLAPAAEPYRPVSLDEARTLLEDVAAQYDRGKVDGYLDDAQARVLEAIIRPFGLAKVLFEDKDGGNVTTSHNASQGDYARLDVEGFKGSEYRGQAYKTSRDRYVDDRIEHNTGTVQDEYSGEHIDYSVADCDHVVAVDDFHARGGFMLDKDERAAFGADQDNFALTHQSGNRSMKETPIKEWHGKTATDGSGRSNKERHGHDNRRVNARIKKGEKAVDRHLTTGKKAAYYGERLINTGAQEAAKMGLQQALGAFLLELTRASWDEIRDALSVGLRSSPNQTLIQAIGERLKRVGTRVLGKWKEAVTAFREGAISGFLSNLVTVVVNTFFTTAKNVVRMIREGFMSLVRGVRLILNAPAGMTKSEAYHEAGKILAAGVAVGVGIAAEEFVQKAVISVPVIGAFAGTIAPVLVGIGVGLGTALLCYLWDKLDLFDAEAERRHRFILDTLEERRAASTNAADEAWQIRGRLSKDCDRLIEEIDTLTADFYVLAGTRGA